MRHVRVRFIQSHCYHYAFVTCCANSIINSNDFTILAQTVMYDQCVCHCLWWGSCVKQLHSLSLFWAHHRQGLWQNLTYLSLNPSATFGHSSTSLDILELGGIFYSKVISAIMEYIRWICHYIFESAKVLCGVHQKNILGTNWFEAGVEASKSRLNLKYPTEKIHPRPSGLSSEPLLQETWTSAAWLIRHWLPCCSHWPAGRCVSGFNSMSQNVITH